MEGCFEIYLGLEEQQSWDPLHQAGGDRWDLDELSALKY